MPQPVLRTARLVLAPLTDEHLEDEVALVADPEVMTYPTGRASTRDEVAAQHREPLRYGVDDVGLPAVHADRSSPPHGTFANVKYR